MDGDFFNVDGGVREVGYAILAGVALSLYVANALMRPAPADRRGLRRELWGRHVSLAVMAMIGVVAAVGIACFAPPQIEDYTFREGGVLESVSAGSFLSVFFMGGCYWLFARDRGVVNMGLIALGLGGFLDEISYGMQLFEFRAPTIGGIRIDGFHDILEWSWRGENMTPFFVQPIVMAAFGASAIGLLFGAWWKRDWIAGAIGECLSSPAIWYAPWIVAFGLASCAIDFAVWGMSVGRVRDIGPYLEEALEMSAALSLCYAWYADRRLRQFGKSQATSPIGQPSTDKMAARIAA